MDAATAMEGELDDEKVFELIRGEWVETKDEEETQKAKVECIATFLCKPDFSLCIIVRRKR